MCGIVGLFLKDRRLDSSLGSLLSDMLVTMSDRGPDSAGIAVYGKPTLGQIRSLFNRRRLSRTSVRSPVIWKRRV